MFVSPNSYGLKVLNLKNIKINNMKANNKISKMVLALSLVITSFTAKPNTNLGLSPDAIETEKTIKDYFKFPQIVTPVNESQKVEVLFTTNLLGQVDFVLAKTLDQNLKTEIEKQFIKLNLTKLKSDVVHSVTLNIKTI
jgi:hypothetical protein